MKKAILSLCIFFLLIPFTVWADEDGDVHPIVWDLPLSELYKTVTPESEPSLPETLIAPTETTAPTKPAAASGGGFWDLLFGDTKKPSGPAATDTPVPTATDTPVPTATEGPGESGMGFWELMMHSIQKTAAAGSPAADTPVPTDTPVPAAADGPVTISGNDLWNLLTGRGKKTPVPDGPAAAVNEPTAVPAAGLRPADIPVPTAANIPVPTATADPFTGLEIQPGIVDRAYPCGDLKFFFIDQPVMTEFQSGQAADGVFILFRVEVRNDSWRTIKGLKYESFRLVKDDGSGEAYPLSGFFSTMAGISDGLDLLRNDIQSGGVLDTYLVFDVFGNSTDPWVLEILPTERITNEQFPPIRIALPPVTETDTSGSSDMDPFMPVSAEDLFTGLETQPGTVGWEYPFGDLKFSFISQPEIEESHTGQFPEGVFISFHVQIRNNSWQTLKGLKYESFRLVKDDGSGEVYPLSAYWSNVLSILWGVDLLRDDIQPGWAMDTYLAFDVAGNISDSWVLEILPTERITNEQFPPIQIALPHSGDTDKPASSGMDYSVSAAADDSFSGLETQRGVVGRIYPCGDLKFSFVYQPIMTRSQSGQVAEGMFILFRVQIRNDSGRALKGVKYESFRLAKDDGSGEVYPLSEFFSTVTSILWDLNLLRNDIQPGGMLDTYLVFNVQGKNTDPWVLEFLPTERITNEQFPPVRIALPPVTQE